MSSLQAHNGMEYEWIGAHVISKRGVLLMMPIPPMKFRAYHNSSSTFTFDAGRTQHGFEPKARKYKK